MAILIPSKNIYEINNPKIRDNVIDNVSVEQTVVTPNNEYEKIVLNLKLTTFDTTPNFIRDFSLYGNTPAIASNYYQQGALVGIKTTNLIVASVSIPRTSNNSYITKIFYGLNNEGNPRIKTNIKCEKYEGTLTATLTHKLAPNITTTTNNVFPVTQANINVDYGEPTYNNNYEDLNIEKITNEEIEVSQTTTAAGTNPSVTAIVKGENKTNIGDESILIEETDTEYKLSFAVLCGYEKYYGQQNEITETPILFLNQSHTVVCKAEKIVPKQVEISIYGDTLGIDLTDGSITYGSGNKPHSLSGNELLQDSSKTNGIALTEHLANNILNQYAKGKETATLLCSISDYYGYTNATLKSVKGFTKRNNKFYQTSRLTQEEIISSSSEIDKYVNAYITEINYTTKNVYIRTLANLEAIEQNLEELIVSFNFYPYNIDGGYISEIIIDTSSNETLFFITFKTNESFEEFTNKYSENSVVSDFISQVNLRYNPPEDASISFRIDVLDKNSIIQKTLFAENEIQSPIEKTLIFNAYENYSYIRILPFFGNYEHSSNGVIYDISEERGTKIVFEFYLLNNSNLEIEFEVKGLDEKNTAKIISTQKDNLPMSFRLHDEVIPYVFGEDGQDRPMSKNQNGTAKIFEVIGSNIIYDGAVWQELTLLEKK